MCGAPEGRRSRRPAHFPSIITTILDQKLPLNKREQNHFFTCFYYVLPSGKSFKKANVMLWNVFLYQVLL
jgi:hypothetical protein